MVLLSYNVDNTVIGLFYGYLHTLLIDANRSFILTSFENSYFIFYTKIWNSTCIDFQIIPSIVSKYKVNIQTSKYAHYLV